MQNSNPVFRKAVFGGFNREDVIEYIEKIKNEFFEYKKDTDQIINELYEKINNLNSMLEKSCEKENEVTYTEETASEKEQISASVNEFSKAAFELKKAAELICGNFSDLFKKISIDNIDFSAEIEEIPEVVPEQAEEVICEEEEQSKSFFDDILFGVVEKVPENCEKSKSSSQFDDLIKI